ncbi:MAG: electron transfer flavoprotein-ubiquinone oxidoreductase [Chromatiales bacterium]|nr:electron transfer flavoprotein-ubiquinone oxidoreductase [Chromatiales bacterium]
MSERESMEFDVVIIGAGPSGLAAACRLLQQAKADGRELNVCVIEKGAEIGAHILSGAVFEPTALSELFPDWKDRGAPVSTSVTHDDFLFLRGEHASMRVPHALIPRPMRNEGNYIISLGRLCQWLASQAEDLGANVFPGFAAERVILEDGRVCGVITGDMGRGADGQPKDGFTPGYELRARYTIFSEGCRGNLGKELIKHFRLNEGRDPQHYSIGLKEIWTIDPALHEEGKVVHTFGWPLASDTEGGGFLYHASGNQVYLGYIVALSYRNPHLSPFHEFQRWKQHPAIRRYLEGGERISYGARAINKGGLQSLPRLVFPGGLLVGCEAGFLNNAKIKGSHTAMKTGMLAAESVYAALSAQDGPAVLEDFPQRVRDSWVWRELHQARNFGPAQKKFGTLGGAVFSYIDLNLFGGRLPFTLRNRQPDHACLDPLDKARPIEYPKPDGKISFDRLSSVFVSNTNHEEDQPVHLKLRDPSIPIERNLPRYGEPARLYCPAGVYEVVDGEDGRPAFRINAQNCVHCKTCDIKDPAQNIHWTVPEGGGGPNYSGM